MTKQEILTHLPYQKPFLFVDEILEVDENSIKGTFTFDKDLYFYKGHFKDYPVTPGVILTETMAQIGLACLGAYLMAPSELVVMMTSSKIDFLRPVFPSEKVTVKSKKNYYRFNKLSCNVVMENEAGEIVCKGEISGMSMVKPHG